jgi:hypothetical protein
LGMLRPELACAQVYDIITKGLHEFLDSLQAQLNSVGEAIRQTFFAHEPLNNGASAAGGPDVDVLSGYQSQGGVGRDRRFTGDLR